MTSADTHQIPMEHPVGVEVVDSVEDLVEERLDHALVDHDLLLVGLGRAVELDDVPQVVLRVVEQQPHLNDTMRRSYFTKEIMITEI